LWKRLLVSGGGRSSLMPAGTLPARGLSGFGTRAGGKRAVLFLSAPAPQPAPGNTAEHKRDEQQKNDLGDQ
ncbi:MAG: hypothetical protein OEM91_15885, partial [Hyphomicrobiales bacterium]|nr:hypothetical protein [Hyphomicrobiales bacterium]